MKNLILILAFIFSYSLTFGQGDSTFFFDEFSISLNETNVNDNNTNDGIGFGIGAYHAFSADKKVNLIIGFEYNKTSQFKTIMYEGHFAHSTDLTYYINSVSIPLTVRVNFGNKSKAFVETGPFLDLNIRARKKGTMHTYLPNANNQIEYNEYEFDGKANISNLNYGISFGLGIDIPLSKYKLMIKPEYKFGVTSLYDYGDQIFNRYFRIMIRVKI